MRSPVAERVVVQETSSKPNSGNDMMKGVDEEGRAFASDVHSTYKYRGLCNPGRVLRSCEVRRPWDNHRGYRAELKSKSVRMADRRIESLRSQDLKASAPGVRGSGCIKSSRVDLEIGLS